MPPLAGPRLMLCWTRQPVKTWTEPSSMRTGKWTVSSRLTSRRLPRASSERPMTSAAASNRRCAVWKAEARVSTAMWRLPIVTPGARIADVGATAPRRHRARRPRRAGHGIRPGRPGPGAASDAVEPGRPRSSPGAERAGAGSHQRRCPARDRVAARADRRTRIGGAEAIDVNQRRVVTGVPRDPQQRSGRDRRGPGHAAYGVDSDVVIRSVVTEKPFVYAVASYLRPTSPPSSAPPRSDRVVR